MEIISRQTFTEFIYFCKQIFHGIYRVVFVFFVDTDSQAAFPVVTGQILRLFVADGHGGHVFQIYRSLCFTGTACRFRRRGTSGGRVLFERHDNVLNILETGNQVDPFHRVLNIPVRNCSPGNVLIDGRDL